ncbi:hypothetical protein [Halobaculum roseum]|uniref:DUF8108 domain-containing protein n=1 Tax=Halobaculum roseum TaxID=2175149 RepID=A0ABD5MSJ6_9EURY|nr:hypothetical protein [Halobaculum roseum]QZY01938.1 hypothetical protein K6T36_11535 [Halobaculum roseum]
MATLPPDQAAIMNAALGEFEAGVAASAVVLLILALSHVIPAIANSDRVYSRFTFGKTRNIVIEDVVEPIQQNCINCGQRSYNGKKITYRTDYALFGYPVWNLEKGANLECSTCHEVDWQEYAERSELHNEPAELDKSQIERIENDLVEHQQDTK